MKQLAPPASEDVVLAAVADALRHIVRAVRVSSYGAEAKVAVTGAQLFVLQQLAEMREASLNEIAARTMTHQSSVSVVVSRLVARGYIDKRVSSEDARRAKLRVTAAGRALLKKAPELAHARIGDALRQASQKDLRATARVLGLVARHVGAGIEPPEMFFETPPTAKKRGAK